MREILDRLLAFDTVSSKPNMELMDYVQGLLEAAGLAVTLVPDAGGGKANLYASIGPAGRGGDAVGPYRCGAGRGAGLDRAALRADRGRRAAITGAARRT